MQLFENLKLEVRLVLRSRWSVGLIMTLLLVLAFAANSSYSLAAHNQDDRIKKIQGATYKEWIIKDDGAKSLREPVQALHPNMGPNLYIAFLGIIGPLLLTLFGANVVGAEFGHKTVRMRAAHQGWAETVGAKVILTLIASTILIGFVAVVGTGINRLVWSSAVKSIEIASWIKGPSVSYSIAKQFLALVSGLFFYGSLGAFLALITRSTAAGMVIGIGIPYVEQYLRTWWLPQSSYGYLLSKHIFYAPGGIISPPPGTLMPPVEWYSWLAMVGWVLLVVVGLYIVPRRQEIN